VGRRRRGSGRSRNRTNGRTRTKHPSTATGSLRDQSRIERRRSLPERRRWKLQDRTLSRQRRVPTQLRRATIPSSSSNGLVRSSTAFVQFLPSHHQHQQELLLLPPLLLSSPTSYHSNHPQPKPLERLSYSLLQHQRSTTMEPPSPLVLFVHSKLQLPLFLPESFTATSASLPSHSNRRLRTAAAAVPPSRVVDDNVNGSLESRGARRESRARDELTSWAGDRVGKDEDTVCGWGGRRKRSAPDSLRVELEPSSASARIRARRLEHVNFHHDERERSLRSLFGRTMDHVRRSGRTSRVAGGGGG